MSDSCKTLAKLVESSINFNKKTRVHSSRMRTTHLLPVSPSMHCSGGCTLPWRVYLPGGVYLPKGVVPAQGGVPTRGCTCPGGVPAWGGCTYLGVYLPRGGVPAWGEYLSGSVPARGCTCRGVYLPRRELCLLGGYLPRYSPPVNRMTDRCKNITLPQTFVCGR